MTIEAPRLFGTDGIRGPFGEPPLDRQTVEQFGFHLASSYAANGSEACLVLGGDTRASTPTLAAWVAAGLTAAGGGFRYAGVLPTPGIAVVTRRLELDRHHHHRRPACRKARRRSGTSAALSAVRRTMRVMRISSGVGISKRCDGGVESGATVSCQGAIRLLEPTP